MIRFVAVIATVALAVPCLSAQDSQFTSAGLANKYTVTLTDPARHLVRVRIELPPGPAERYLRLPVWYALYQIRDFAEYVKWVRPANGSPISIHKLEPSRWRIDGAEGGAEVDYEIFADDPGAFGAELNSHHAFFNLAEILMYETDVQRPLQIRFVDIPTGWRIATGLQPLTNGFGAQSYDQLVDSPVEISAFDEGDFDESGGHYRVIVDANRGEYVMNDILSMVERVVGAEVSWMRDRPFGTYIFFYHFPHESGGGGMEHANSAAISVDASRLSDSAALAGLTAHEFFHLWNVKRIRPQALEPVDYIKANYTDALWFSEGVTNTVEGYTLLRAGFIDQRDYLDRLGRLITNLEDRPAHLTQSAEGSSLDTWLERYPYYRRPDRSISYYNKGELLGVLLDLKMRDMTNDTKSLRDLFQWMNANYAQKGRFFEDSGGVRQAAEELTRADLKSFFDKYVAGVDEIPWNDYFNTVGLQLVAQKMEVADAGFTVARNFDSPLTVMSVNKNGKAAKAGLVEGDMLLEVNGEIPGPDIEQALSRLRPGDKIKIRIRNRNGNRVLSWKLDSQQEVDFQLRDLPDISAAQKSRRAAWLRGESEPAGETLP